MITLNSKDNSRNIEISISDEITETLASKRKGYIVKLPMVICTNKEDAETIQQRVNSMVIDMAKEICK